MQGRSRGLTAVLVQALLHKGARKELESRRSQNTKSVQEMAPTGSPKAAAVPRKTPNFSGEWLLERSENHREFLRAIGYSALIAQTAFLAEARQSIQHVGDELRCRFETVPPLAPTRFAVINVGADQAARQLPLCHAWP